ncbi:hypothetical protein [Actinomadura gamaensis]|uniref:Integral membrane protein n=1 Tax=Actinomadura gamaensis TaxID=1763541 RepID=A0ABV9TSB0_9ACTN
MTNTAVNSPNVLDASAAVRRVTMLAGSYAAVSVTTVTALAAAGASAAQPVWIRLGIVAVSSLVLVALTLRAARGSSGAYRRVRIVSTVMLAATVVIVALPGMFPVWMRLEQAACALLLAGVALIAHGRTLRTHFAK